MEKVKPPENINYAATVVRVRTVTSLPGLDNLVGIPLLGYQALVSKDTAIGDLGIVFTSETQLDLEFASENNLHRHGNLNADPDAKGYLEDNRRVRAIKLRGHRSDALFMSLKSLAYTGFDITQLKEGDTFDELNGHKICTKYVIRQKGPSNQPATYRVSRVDEIHLPKHFDTANYFRNPDLIPPDAIAVVTQKLHGTSVRIGHTLVRRKLSWLERVAKRLKVKVQETEYAYVYGSRNVIKDPDNPFAQEYYGTDIHTAVGSRLKGLLPKGYVVYGEIIGWANQTPIQKGYTYRIPQGEAELYVYRVTRVGEDGHAIDLSWVQVQQFCTNIGVKAVPELATYEVDEESISTFLDFRFADAYPNVVPTDGDAVDEGVCIRHEGLIPLVLKAKSPKFLEHETKMLDKGIEDMDAGGDV